MMMKQDEYIFRNNKTIKLTRTALVKSDNEKGAVLDVSCATVAKKDNLSLLEGETSLNIKKSTITEAFRRRKKGDKSGSVSVENSERYKFIKVLGEGGSGKVLAVHDHDLQRDIAIKVSTADDIELSLNKFISEARILACLEHPTIIPIYDIDVDEEGTPYFLMRRIQGKSLKELLDEEAPGRPVEEIDSVDKILRIFLKVCDGVAYAHSKGKLHQDIKPENIMIGEFGEVFVIDWGSSSVSDQEEYLQVTPGYMSPEQAMGDATTPATDIYSLGVTLFHLLYKRLPTYAETMEEMVQKKSKGIIELPSADERENIPAPLEAIVLKALAYKKEERYQSVKDLAEDIMHFQAGQSVSVYKDTLWTFAKRWFQRNKRQIAYISLMIGILTGAFVILWHEKLKEVAYWGRPKYSTELSVKELKKNWIVNAGKFVDAAKGGIVSQSANESSIFYKQKLYGNTAVEFEAEMLPGYREGDLSVLWVENLKHYEHNIVKTTGKFYYLQTGAWNNTFCMIQEVGRCLAYSPTKLTVGKTYTIRVEIEYCTLRLFLDGKLLCEYTRDQPFTQGYIGLYSYYAGKRFKNFRIYSKGMPEKIDILAFGNLYFQKGDYENAVKVYSEIVKGATNPDTREKAMFFEGRTLFIMGKKEDAFAVWENIKSSHFKGKINLYRIQEMFSKRNYDAVLKALEQAYTTADKQMKLEIQAVWSKMAYALYNKGNFDEVNCFIKFQERFFLKEKMSRYTAVSLLLWIGNYKRIIEEYQKDFPYQYYSARLARGEFDYIKKMNMETRLKRCDRLLLTNQNEKILKEYSNEREMCAKALFNLKRYDMVLKKYPERPVTCAKALLYQKKYNEVLKQYGALREISDLARIKLKRYNEILAFPKIAKLVFYNYAACKLNKFSLPLKRFPENRDVRFYVDSYKAIQAYFHGSRADGLTLFKELNTRTINIPIFRADNVGVADFYFYILPMVIDMNYKGTDKQALKQKFELVKQKYRYVGCQRFYYLLGRVVGEISEKKFLDQPLKVKLKFQICLYNIIEAERQGDIKKALHLYKHILTEYEDVECSLLGVFATERIKEIEKQLKMRDN